MKEHPILFSGAMVRAILDGTKTQTRRVVKPQPKVVHALHSDASLTTERLFRHGDQRIHYPYGCVGDRLWVRETFVQDDGVVRYRADMPNGDQRPWANPAAAWRPSIFMPRWASRITLEVVSVRVERVQSISEADAEAEGVDRIPQAPAATNHRTAFAGLWNSINAKRGYGWDANPYVWVVEFEAVQS